jgi:hypothetical protein
VPWQFKDYVSDKNPFCTEDKNCPERLVLLVGHQQVRAAGAGHCLADAAGVLQRLVCADVWAAPAERLLVGQLRGMTATAELGKSFISRGVGQAAAAQAGAGRRLGSCPAVRSDRAASLCAALECRVCRRRGQEYSSLTVQVRPGRSVTRIVERVRKLGYSIEDNGAEQAGLAVLLMTALFVLVSLSTLVVAALNVAHTFFRAIAERRHELGVMRAVGATQGDIKTLLLGEAVAVGVLGGVLGVLLAYLVGLGIDLLSRKVLPDFPFKPESYFWFSPGLVALLLGFSVLVCLLGALWPARTAAKLSPAQSLSGR